MATVDEPKLFARFWQRLPIGARFISAISLFALVAMAGYWGANHFPDVRPIEGNEAERKVASLFVVNDNADSVLAGDLLIERFYVMDVASGEAATGVLLKGRVRGLTVSERQDGTGIYTINVDRSGLGKEKDRLTAFIAASAPPPVENVKDLGLFVQEGEAEVVRLNYDARLPQRRHEFRGPRGEGVYAFLDQERRGTWLGARLLNMKGTNYLLSSTDVYPLFRTQFGVGRAVFLSELVLVDATSKSQSDLYLQICQKIPPLP
jgi:hypothetical protein